MLNDAFFTINIFNVVTLANYLVNLNVQKLFGRLKTLI